MKIYIDCEFNQFGGDLISMALVAENGEEFYENLARGLKDFLNGTNYDHN